MDVLTLDFDICQNFNIIASLFVMVIYVSNHSGFTSILLVCKAFQLLYILGDFLKGFSFSEYWSWYLNSFVQAPHSGLSPVVQHGLCIRLQQPRPAGHGNPGGFKKPVSRQVQLPDWKPPEKRWENTRFVSIFRQTALLNTFVCLRMVAIATRKVKRKSTSFLFLLQTL